MTPPITSGQIERNYPWVIGLITAATYLGLSNRVPLSPGIKDVFTATVGMAAIAVGFLITASSILVSIDDKWIVQRAKEAGSYRALVRYMISATKWSLFAAALTSAALFYDPGWRLWWYPYGVCVWLFSSITMMLTLFRVLQVFSEVLLALSDK